MERLTVMDRKQFLTGAAATVAAAFTGSWSYADPIETPPSDIVVTVDPHRKGHVVSPSITGLSYEMAQLGNPDFFSAQNKDLVSLFRRLSDHGVLRLGGNTVEFTDWTPDHPTSTQTPLATTTVGHRVHRRTPITQTAIDNLAQFLTATGWSLIYGLNLGTGTPESAADEAKYVSKAVGKSLVAFQIGNEPDLFRVTGQRTPDWAYQDYFAEWTQFADAILQENPGLPLAGPDVANNQSWLSQFAEAANDRIVLLTAHYYAEGPPSSPRATIDTLLHQSPKLQKDISGESKAMNSSGLPFRMSESNSCYNGGKTDVSDTFASALWGADYMLELAQAGQTGVNFHGGGNGSYTPIAGSLADGFTARPLYYGILFAQQFAGMSLLETSIGTSAANVTAYAAHSKDSHLIALFNKDIDTAHTFQVVTGSNEASARMWSLAAPVIDAKAGVTLAGAAVGPDGSWSPADTSIAAATPGQFQVLVPAGSAALLFV